MKIVPQFDIKQNEDYRVIIKNFDLQKKFFNKYINNYIKVKSCPICNDTNFENIAPQYRQFLFYDFKENDKKLKHYFNNIKFQLNNEQLEMCKNCGLVFSNCNYDYNFFLDYMQIEDGADPSIYDENLLSIDKYYGIAKHNARVKKIFNLKFYTKFFFSKIFNKFFNIKKSKFLEVSSYRSWALDKLNYWFDVYGIEPNYISVKFSNNKFPHLSKKIKNNLFEMEENNFLSKNKFFDIVLFSMCFRHMQNPYKSLEILEKITSKDSIVIIDESEYLDSVSKKITTQEINVENFSNLFLHGKMFYYSKIHIIYLMNKYSFQLIEEYETKDKKYPNLTQSTLVFKKNNKNIRKDFNEEFRKNYQNVKVLNEKSDILSKFKNSKELMLFTIE